MASVPMGGASYGSSFSNSASFADSSYSSQSPPDEDELQKSCLTSPLSLPINPYSPRQQENDAPWQVPRIHTNDVIRDVENRLKTNPVTARVVDRFPSLAQKIVMAIDRQTSREAHLYSQQSLMHYANRLFQDIEVTASRHPLVVRAFKFPYTQLYGTHPAMIQICGELYASFEELVPDHLGILPAMLAWIHFARRTLNARELQHALRFSLDVNPPQQQNATPSFDYMNSAAGGFIRFEDSEEEIIVPESLKDGIQWYYRVTGQDQYQPYMALACLAYINAAIEAQGPCPDRYTLDQRLQEFPFLQYAIENWVSHIPPGSYNMESFALYLNDDRIIQSMMQILGRAKLLHLSDREIKPSDPSQWYYKNTTGLAYAASIGCYPLVKAFLTAGHHPNSNLGYLPPLVSAAMTGHSRVVALLVQYGADVNVRDFAGRTALYFAAVGGYHEIVDILLSHMVDVNSQAKDRTSPLMAAICNGHLEIAKTLFRYGARANAVAFDGQTALSSAIMKPGFADFAITMFSLSLGPFNLSLSIESDVTLWEACSGIQDDAFRHQILDCIKKHDFIMDSGAALTLRQAWKESLLLTLSLDRNCSPAVEAPARAKANRKRRGMMSTLSNEFRQRYMLECYLGKGAFSSAWKAIDLVTGQHVVAKFLMESSNHHHREDSKHECRLMLKMNHQNVLKCLDSMELDGGMVIITEFAQRGDLQWYLRRCQPIDCRPGCLPEHTAKFMFAHVMKGLSYMHSRNVVHRDLKPENILVFENNVMKIADLGNSTKIPSDHNGYVDFMPCTPTHIAPEAMQNGSESSESSSRSFLAKPCDIWSAGACLYQMLVGKQPFPTEPGDSTYDVLRGRILVGDLHFDDWNLWGCISDLAIHLVARMLDHDPERRPTAEEVLQHPWITGNIEKGQMLDFDGLRAPHGQYDGALRPRNPEWATPPVVRTRTGQNRTGNRSLSDDIEDFRSTQVDWITDDESGLPVQ